MHAKDLYERLAAGYDYDPMYGELCNERDGLKKENAKLRELAGLLLYGMCHDAPPHEELLWSQRVNRLTDELGIEA